MTTTNTATVTTTATEPVTNREWLAALKGTAFYREAEQRGTAWVTALLADADVARGEGLDLAEYLDGVETWPTGLATMLCEGMDVDSVQRDLDPAIITAREAWQAAYHNALEGGASESAAWAAANAATAFVPETATETAIDPNAVAAAEAVAAEAKEAAAKAADVTLKALVTAYRKGEREYRAGLLATGVLCHQYVVQRLALGATRALAIQTIEGQLAAYATTSVDADRMIRAAMAHRLLLPTLAACGGKESDANDVPYGTWRDHYSRLVMRTNKGTADETYALLNGMEEQCQTLFATSTANRLDGKAIGGKVSDMVRAHTAMEEAATKAAAEEARKAEQAAAAEQLTAQQDRIAAWAAAEEAKKQAAAAAEQAAATEQDAAKLEHSRLLNAAAKEAADALLAKQRAEIVANEQAAEAKRLAAMAEAERKAAEKAAANQAAKDKRAEEKQAQRPAAPAEARQGTNLMAAAKHGTAKDVAGMVVELITGGDAPDDVLDLVMAALDGHGDLSKPSHHAVKAFRTALDNAKRRTATVRPAAATA